MKKKLLLISLIMLAIFLTACSRETLELLIFTPEEMEQIKTETFGDEKYFRVPNKDWKIGMYLPDYTVVKHDFVIFQASRHYNGEHLITVVTTVINPETGVNDLASCKAYREKILAGKDFLVEDKGDQVIFSKVSAEGLSSKTTTILQFYDNFCIDTSIITSQLNDEALTETDKIVNSIKIVPSNYMPEVAAPVEETEEVVVEEPTVETKKTDKTVLYIEGEDWVTLVNLEGFEDSEEDFGKIPSRFLFKLRTAELVYITVFGEIVSSAKSSEECRTFYTGDVDPSIKPTELWEKGNRALSSYTTYLTFTGETIKDKHVNTFLYYKGYCFDFHMSKLLYEAGDMKYFFNVIDTIEFVPLAGYENQIDYRIEPITVA